MRSFWKTRFRLSAVLLAAVGMLGFGALTGCEDEDPVEEAVEEVADEVDDAI